MRKPRFPFLPAEWLAATALVVSIPASAKAPPSDNRAQAFVVAASDDLQHSAGELTHILRTVLSGGPGVEMVDLAEKLKAPPPEKIKDLTETARRELVAAKAAMKELEHAKVVEHATAARAAFEKMGGYIDPLDRYKESILLVGVGQAMQGNSDAAREAFLDLLLLDPHLNLPRKEYEGFVIEAFNAVRQGLDALPRGSLSIKTQPPGATFFLDGKQRGVTPDSVDGIPAGNHLLTIQMPGHSNYGKVIRIEAGNLLSLTIKLEAGRAGSGFNQLIEAAGRAVASDSTRGEVLRLGQTIGLNWAWLCKLSHHGPAKRLHCFLVEFGAGRSIYDEKLDVEDEYGMEEDVRRFSQRFLERGLDALKRFREEGDPLAGHSGTEGWNEETDDEQYRKKDRPAPTAAEPPRKKKTAGNEWDEDEDNPSREVAKPRKKPAEETFDDDDEDATSARRQRDNKGDMERKRTHKKESGDPLDELDGTEDW